MQLLVERTYSEKATNESERELAYFIIIIMQFKMKHKHCRHEKFQV